MKSVVASLLSFVVLTLSAFSQSASDPNEGSRLISLGSGSYQFTWWARAGNPYLVEFTTDFVTWTYVPTLFNGTGGIIYPPVGFNSVTNDHLFVRLQKDPFHTDSDGDGIPDGWEVLYGLNPRDSTDAQGAAPGGLTYLQKFQMGLNPTTADTDGDGVNDNLDGWPLDPDLSPAPVLEAQYAVLDLTHGLLLGGLNPDDLVSKVNNKCQVIGTGSTDSPFFWDSGVRTAIPMQWATDINNNGVVTGEAFYEDEYVNAAAARWSVGQSSPGLLYAYEPDANVLEPVSAIGYGINDSGAIVGASSAYTLDPVTLYLDYYSCGTLWTGSSPALVGALNFFYTEGSPPACSPIAINNAGVIVGSIGSATNDPFAPGDAFVLESSSVTRLQKLPPPPPPFDSITPSPWAGKINQSGTVASGGMSQNLPVIWVKKDGEWKAKNIGPYNSTTQLNDFVPGEIYGPNERTEFVGLRYDTPDTVPFVLQNGKLVDLNTRVPSTWRVTTANSINDSGVISATVYPIDDSGQVTGNERSALLLPVDTIQMDAFIPEEWVFEPVGDADNPKIDNGNSRKTPLDGDNYTSGPAIFNANSREFKVRQKIGVTSVQNIDPTNDSENETKLTNVGPTRRYYASVLVNGHIPATAVPLNVDTATPSIDTITITHPSPGVVVTQMEGQVSNPLAIGGDAGPIHWIITVTINRSNPAQPTYHVTGTHCRFPAYELYINGQQVHVFDPVSGGYDPSGLLDFDRTFDNTGNLQQ